MSHGCGASRRECDQRERQAAPVYGDRRGSRGPPHCGCGLVETGRGAVPDHYFNVEGMGTPVLKQNYDKSAVLDQYWAEKTLCGRMWTSMASGDSGLLHEFDVDQAFAPTSRRCLALMDVPSDLACQIRPVWQSRTVPALSALLPVLPRRIPALGFTRLLRQPGEDLALSSIPTAASRRTNASPRKTGSSIDRDFGDADRPPSRGTFRARAGRHRWSAWTGSIQAARNEG